MTRIYWYAREGYKRPPSGVKVKLSDADAFKRCVRRLSSEPREPRTGEK